MAKSIKEFTNLLLTSKKIGVDSMIFIYQFSDHPQYSAFTNVFFELLEKGKIKAVTSTISIIEILAKPEEEKNMEITQEYEKILNNFPNLELVAVDNTVARLSAKLRGTYKTIKVPDAIQIAVTILKNYPVFLTNDIKLKQIKELKVITLQDFI
jgi:predicted nucleic acid-binding protein